MPAFTPTEEQQQLIDTIRRFAVNDIQPMAHEADENERIPARIVQMGWDIGLTQTAIPEAYGGLGEMSALTGALAAEALAYGDLSVALEVLSPALFAYPIILSGTDEQRANFLPPFASEQMPHASAALLEPGVFFDANHLKTTASASGEKIRLEGEKAYVPLGATADWLLVYARDSESGRIDGYLLEAGTPGVVIGKREPLMGIRALPTYRVALEGVEVDVDCRLGGADGCDYAKLLDRSRVALAALAVGVASAAAEYARNYAKQRVQFGVPIAQKQAIAFMQAEMAIEVDAARLMVWEAAWMIDQGADATKEAYLAKQYADKSALFVTDSAVQTLGGYGFIREYPAERWLRNARGFTTFHGLAIVQGMHMTEKKRDSLIVQPGDSLDPEIGRGLWRLEDARKRTMVHLAGLDPAALDWHPDWTLHSIGTLLYHIAMVEADWLYVEVLELPEDQMYPGEMGALFPYPMRTDGKLTPVTGVSFAEHLDRLDTTRRHLLDVFRAMRLDNYRRPRSLAIYDVTPEWVLHHLSQHEAEHRSEIGALQTQFKRQSER